MDILAGAASREQRDSRGRRRDAELWRHAGTSCIVHFNPPLPANSKTQD